MSLTVANMAADLSEMQDNAPALLGTITTVETTPQTVEATFSPVRKQADTQEIGMFHESDMTAVGVLSEFTGTVPAERATVIVTCSGLSLSAVRFTIDSKETDTAAFTFQLKRAT